MNNFRKQVKECKKILEHFLSNNKDLIICSDNCRGPIDRDVVNHLMSLDYEEFLEEDISVGYQIGGVSERALCELVNEEKIFDGRNGKYKLQETYGPMSVRSFEAWKV